MRYHIIDYDPCIKSMNPMSSCSLQACTNNIVSGDTPAKHELISSAVKLSLIDFFPLILNQSDKAQTTYQHKNVKKNLRKKLGSGIHMDCNLKY